jgi:heavy-metal-associated domain-containing protein
MGALRFIDDVRAASHEEPVRIIYRVHSCPGRVRYRLTWLRDFPGEGARIADRLSAFGGVVEVRVRELTGSVLVFYDPDFVDETNVARVLLGATNCDHVTEAGHETPEDLERMLRDADERGSAISRALVATVEGLHTDFLRKTGGRVSLASASALLMLAAGFGRLGSAQGLELPPWHQLIWYAYNTFKDVQERYSAGHTVHKDA